MMKLLSMALLIGVLGCSRTGNPAKSTSTNQVQQTKASAIRAGHETSNPNTLSSEAQLALKLINQARATGRTCKDDKSNEGYFPAVKPVGWNLKLEASARNHSTDMKQRNYFAHASPSGVTLQKRLETVGYVWQTIGENIAAGQPTLERAVEGWIGSADHCVVLMKADFTQMGLGRVDGSEQNKYKVYWTLDFGTPR
jgi:uncharacterized protein YkwD